MSKSLGNLVFVDELRKEWDPRAIRLAVLEHHYRHSVGVGRGADAARRGPARSLAGRRRAGRPTARASTRRGRRSTTTSTRRARWPRSTPPPRGARACWRPRRCWASTSVKRQPSDSKTTARGHPNHTRRQPGPRRIGRVTSASSDEHPGANALQDRWRALAAPLAKRLWRIARRGLRPHPRGGPGDPLPEPHQLPRLRVPDADACPGGSASSARPSTWTPGRPSTSSRRWA